MAKYILGISCFYHDAAAALIKDGVVVSAAQEERFTRIKFDESFPKNAIEYCLSEGKISAKELDAVVFYEKPLLHLNRIIMTSILDWPASYKFFIQAIPVWMKYKLWFPLLMKWHFDYNKTINYTMHHLSHAASAYYPSGFLDAAVLTVDAVGEWESVTIWRAKGVNMKKIASLEIPNSLGLLYSTITSYLGFHVNNGEYKVMGLAPYGKDTYLNKLKKLIEINKDGSFSLVKKYFTFTNPKKMYTNELIKLLGIPPRLGESPINQKHKDIAKSLQTLLEEILDNIAVYIKKQIPTENLCYAGGVALNCVANTAVFKKHFKKIYIQPAAGDSGGAVGCALYYYFNYIDKNLKKTTNPMSTIYLGPSFTDKEILTILKKYKIKYKIFTDNRQLNKQVAEMIDKQNIVGWFKGRMEYGPRSLGNRSILADPRNKENWQRVNLKIKYRESFRPFAPALLFDDLQKYIEWKDPSPYMLFTGQVKTNTIPAVTHVDGSARFQTVQKEANAKFYSLLNEFKKQTGCSVLINTSFNVRGEPIVCTPRDAIYCFFNTEMDILVMNNTLIDKKENTHLSKNNFKQYGKFID
jgi:carbamoyltransferase